MKYENAFLLAASLLGASLFINAVQFGIQLKNEHIISTQKLLLSSPSEDTVRFDCRHCGWSHNLSTKDTTTNLQKNEK